MIYNNVSIKTLLSYIKGSFNFNDDAWKTDCIEYIGWGLEFLGSSPFFEKTHKNIEIKSYRGALPTNLNTIIEIQYCGQKLSLNRSNDFLDSYGSNVNYYDGESAQLNPNWIHTSFETGTVTIFYFKLPTDDEGFPLIPDNPKVFEALNWWVIYKLLTGGHKHHTIKDWKEAYQMWNSLYPQAQNAAKISTPMEKIQIAEWYLNPLSRETLEII